MLMSRNTAGAQVIPSTAASVVIFCASAGLLGLAACGGDGTEPPASYRVGGTVSGLSGGGLVLLDNGGDALAVSGTGAFEFAHTLANGGSYIVTVKTQPSGPNQNCTVSAGSGTVAASNVTSVSVECQTLDNFAYSISDGVYGWKIDPSFGELTALATGNPTVATGLTSMAATANGQYVYGTGASSNGYFVTSFAVDAKTGVWTALPNGTVSINTPGSFLLSPNSQFAYVVGGAATIMGFRIDSQTGELVAIPGGPFGDGSMPAGATFSPNGQYLYVSDLPVPFCDCVGSLSIYAVNPNSGALGPIVGSPFASTAAPTTFTPNGRFAYTIGSLNGSYPPDAVIAYSVSASGAVTPVAGSPFALNGYPVSLTIDPSGTHLYTAFNQDGGIAGFSIDPASGSLVPIAGSPFPVADAGGDAGLDVQAVVVITGSFAYVAGAVGIYGYSIDPSGALIPLSVYPPFSGAPFIDGFYSYYAPSGITIDTTGQFLFIANPTYNNVAAFRIDVSTGALTPSPNSPYSAPDASAPYLLK
jgi:6-phosphogluconolactonase (cycloisomerase 2 family)